MSACIKRVRIPGQMVTAKNIWRLTRGSEINRSHQGCSRVQDAYSLRCMPQVHGAVRDALDYARQTFEREMNSATDNPLVFVERRGRYLRGQLPRPTPGHRA